MSLTAGRPAIQPGAPPGTEAAPVPAPADPLAAREERLVSVLRRATRRAGGGFTERWLGAVGAALAVAGLGLVVIGWVGTSRTVLVAGQIPYVVSGGLLGLGLVFLGGFSYFGFWLATGLRASRERDEQNRRDLGQLESQLEQVNRTLLAITDLLADGVATRTRRPPPARN